MSSIEEIENATERKVLAIDFDKTLTTGEGPNYWEDDEDEQPDEDMIEWVNEQYHSGHVIIVWTARPWSQAANVESYLTKWGVEYHGIRCQKTGADLYVDDKARNVEDVAVHQMSSEIDSKVTEVVTEDFAEKVSEEATEDEEENEPFDPDNPHYHKGEVTFTHNGRLGFIEAPRVTDDVFFSEKDEPKFPNGWPEEGDTVIFEYEDDGMGPRVTEIHGQPL